VSAPHAVASVVVDRLLGVLSILLVGIVAVEWSVDLLHGPLLTANLLAAFAICGIALALILAPAPGRSLPVPGWLRSSRALTYLTALRAYQPHPRQLAYVLLLSIAVQVLRVGQAYAAGVALHITQASFLDYLVYVPIIVLLMQLPITINGIGTCQVAFVWFFGQRGVPAPQAFALSVLFLLLGVAGNLPGSVLYAAHGLTRRRLPAPTGI
jgi:uncharacterized membrane protein YbhN (UPF0104 family)